MSVPEIKLYFDILSPFAYEAYYVLRHNETFRDVKMTFVPIFLHTLMKMTGNAPPMRVKNKDAWITRERIFWANVFKIPMKREHPKIFPPNTLALMRIISTLDDQAAMTKILDRLWHDSWVHHAEIWEADVFTPVIDEILGAAGAEKAYVAAPTQGQETLHANTLVAFETGAFGVPWMVCTNAQGETEGFWGFDHLGQVVQFLDLPKLDTSEGWKTML